VSLSTLLAALLALQDRGPTWTRHTIDAGSRGADGIRLADANGDVDVLACEEIENLGVFWYENPSKP